MIFIGGSAGAKSITTVGVKGMRPILVIVGPTAVGKTELAIEVAKEVDGEIISADSMQVYRGLDIGTAKPTEEERQGIPTTCWT